MKLKWLGALVGAAMLATAAPAGATTVTGTGIVTSAGSIAAGDPALSFGATDLANGAQGINGADFDHGKRYFDYIFSFALTGPADLTLSAAATAGTNILDYHAALFSSAPAGTDLLQGHNPGPLTGLTDTTGLLAAASTSGNGSLNTLDAANLGSGDYYLRLFGVIAGNSDINSHLTALAGTITAVAATPIPTGLLLFATGLGALGFVVWRRRAPGAAAAA
jgi:hypothetical protein